MQVSSMAPEAFFLKDAFLSWEFENLSLGRFLRQLMHLMLVFY